MDARTQHAARRVARSNDVSQMREPSRQSDFRAAGSREARSGSVGLHRLCATSTASQKAKPQSAIGFARHMIAQAICRCSPRSSPISSRRSCARGRTASASLSWRAGECPDRRSSAARQSQTSATSGAFIGGDGSGRRAGASSRRHRFASTPTPGRARRRNGSRSMRNGRCSLSPAYGRAGGECAGQRARRSRASMRCRLPDDGSERRCRADSSKAMPVILTKRDGGSRPVAFGRRTDGA
jgi:hypothetical protein